MPVSKSESEVDDELRDWYSALAHKFETFSLHGLIYGHGDAKNFLDIVDDLQEIINRIKDYYEKKYPTGVVSSSDEEEEEDTKTEK